MRTSLNESQPTLLAPGKCFQIPGDNHTEIKVKKDT